MGYTDNCQALTDEEIQRLNEEIFNEELEQAMNCSHCGHINHYTCDGCGVSEACSTLSNGY